MKTPEQLKVWWKLYEKETVFNRAVPNIMDGMKPVVRKIFFTALYKFGTTNRSMNTNAFSGAVKEYSNYHHGDMSLISTINNLTSDYKNNIPMFNSDANFGNRLVQESAAARYTDITLNKNFTKYLIMKEILTFEKQDDNNFYEPNFYFFSIPIVLINGISGIAVGIKTDILSYDIDDIKKNIINVLSSKPQKRMIPKVPAFRGTVKEIDGRWYQYGIFKKISSTEIKILEIPTNYDRTKYITFLQKLKEEGKILNYTDLSSANFEFDIKVERRFFEKYNTDEQIYNVFKIKSSMSQNIAVLSPECDEVIIFNSPEELIERYVLEMLKNFSIYIDYKIAEHKENIKKLEHKTKFIEYVLSIDIRKFSSKQIKAEAIKLGISEDYIDDFMRISILNLTNDSIKEHNETILKEKEFLKYFSNVTPQKYYMDVLEKS